MNSINLSRFLSLPGDLLITSPEEAAMSRLNEIVVQSLTHIGIMGDGFPLLANLSLMENIALAPMYHQNLGFNQCRKLLSEHIKTLGLERAMDMRKEGLSRRELLQAHVLRCLASHSGIILFPSPSVTDAEDTLAALEALGRPARLWIACLDHDSGIYNSLNLTRVNILES